MSKVALDATPMPLKVWKGCISKLSFGCALMIGFLKTSIAAKTGGKTMVRRLCQYGLQVLLKYTFLIVNSTFLYHSLSILITLIPFRAFLHLFFQVISYLRHLKQVRLVNETKFQGLEESVLGETAVMTLIPVATVTQTKHTLPAVKWILYFRRFI